MPRADQAQRIRLVIAYDGAPFSGWQRQPGTNSIQACLEEAVRQTCGVPTRLHGSGRTDAGVHALGQVAHFDVAGTHLSGAQWVAALNSRLPGEIRVLRATRVAMTFHARFSATQKTYAYRVWNGPVLPPHELRRAWHIPQALDLEAIMSAAALFVGQHDFAAFAANRGTSRAEGRKRDCASSDDSTVRTMFSVRVVRRGSLITITYTATGFLYKMARLITGALVQCGRSKMTIEHIQRFLSNPQTGKCSHAAPPDGLILLRVRY